MVASASPSALNKSNGHVVHFEDGSAVAIGGSEGIASMYSERSQTQNQHRHMDVQLRSIASQPSGDHLSMAEVAPPYDSHRQFEGGDFSSGKIKHIALPTGCWTMAFSTRANILATGLRDRVEFLETVNYSLLCSVRRSDKVSAIQWCSGSDLSWGIEESNKLFGSSKKLYHRFQDGEIVAVAGLDGQVAMYHVDPSLVEFKGTQTIYEFSVDGEIRCMTFKPVGNGSVILAVGDKKGKVTLITLSYDEASGQIIPTFPIVVDFEGDAVLGLDCYIGEQSILVAGTKSGKMVVFELIVSKGVAGAHFVACGEEIWRTQRNGSVRSVMISGDGKYLSFGGYDKTLVQVNLSLLAIVRELDLQGTINTIASDPLNRFLVVGCRDKSITVFDTSTYFPIKKFDTPGWVTAVSWGVPGIWTDVVAVRSENKAISLLDLTPTHETDIQLPSKEGFGSSVSWTPEGDFLVHVSGDDIYVVDSRCGFTLCAQIKIPGSSVQSVAFSPKSDTYNLAGVGLDGKVYLMNFSPPLRLTLIESVKVEANLWALAWSRDGKFLATGGKGKTLFLLSSDDDSLKVVRSAKLEGRVWDIEFKKQNDGANCAIAVACGDYKTIFFDWSLQPTLQVVRPRTVRCLDFHPKLPLLVMGDGAGYLAIVDYQEEETVKELKVGGRMNSLEFSPAGDFLLVGTDDFLFTLHETKDFKVVQEFQQKSFALSGSFSPSGKYLALGSASEPYAVMRMGSLLGVDLVPLSEHLGKIPEWALNETLFRSGFGPSLVQRHMMRGKQESLIWVSNTLREHPDAIYTLNRQRGEGCLETALRLRKVRLLQAAVKIVVDGSLEKQNGGKRSILTTHLPKVGRRTLMTMMESHPAALIVEILQSLTFVKVPFTKSRISTSDKRLVCGNRSFLDPWKKQPLVDGSGEDEGEMVRTPAVLPIPGLGSIAFLSALVAKAPATAFDNEAMGVVLEVMWNDHIWKYYMIDTCFFLCYYALWIILIELNTSSSMEEGGSDMVTIAVAIVLIVLNSLFAGKEIVQSNYGRRRGYFASSWNWVDVVSILLVWTYAMYVVLEGRRNEQVLVPLAVVTTLLLTTKLIGYLRAFNQTGWLVTVLSRNFWDVRGFLVVLLSIIVGFSASFRLLFATNESVCELELGSDGLVQECYGNPFGSFRRAVLSTFELTILGSYEPSLLYDSKYTALSVLVFILAVTCVLVVALNALISLLADSYARVQEDATANKRKEKAELIVEYLGLLPRWQRKSIEKDTLYFHALLEADADGDLVVEDEDWHGGLNALRDDIEENSQKHADAQIKATENLKLDFERELASLRTEMMAALQDLAEDVKDMKRSQTEGGVTLSGKRVAGAVKAVKEIRSSLFKSSKKDD